MSPFAQLFDQALQRRQAVEDARCATPLESALNFFENGLASPAIPDTISLLGNHRPAWALELDLPLPCTLQDLKRAFRRQALKTHPDRPGGSHEAFLRTTAIFEEALEYLKNPPTRVVPEITVARRNYSVKPSTRPAQVIFAFA